MHAVHGRSRDLLHHPVLPRHRPVLSGCKTGIACVPAERAGRSGVSSSPTMVKGVAHVAGPRRQGSEQRRQRAPHLAEVLQKLSVKRFTATSCNGLRTPGEPRMMGLIVAMTATALEPRSLRISSASRFRCFLTAALDGLISSLLLG